MRDFKLRKLILTAIFASLSFVLSTFVVFPYMAPFQHLINVVAALFLGPYYNLLQALLTGIFRMILNARSILAITGAIIGAFLSGLVYEKTKSPLKTAFAEVFGTGILSALISFPIMKLFFGLNIKASKFYYFIPFFLPSAAVGGFLGFLILLRLKKIKF
ncbi:MAG: energy coupling factor transporter S component ThiW [Tissierellia bacterium]|nr:energy coupling factor transporter S component ThiW [Tissierellia bacterium]